jgi:transcriptional regulator with XRE-family HTH domain
MEAMRRTTVGIAADRAALAVRRRLVEDLGRLREDAGISVAALARAADVPPGYVWRILNGEERPSIETYARLAAVLGADLSARLYPTTGPTIRDRHQARILEAMLRGLSPHWHPIPEIGVRSPVRGWIDVGLHDSRGGVIVATEIESEINRLEQQIRWSVANAEALPSWPGWPSLREPTISRLLVVRWTRQTRAIAAEFPRQLAAAFPASPDDALDALTGSSRWPGPALIWARMEVAGVRLVAGR